ncbi:MAG: hypothetical protein ABWX74_11415 [Aeromicrobium sp.]
MRRCAWLAGLLLLPAACGEATVDAPLPTYTGAAVDDVLGTEAVEVEAHYVQGTLGLDDGCLVVALDQDGDGELLTAILRLPSDGGAKLRWHDDRLSFHERSYPIGSRLVFRATVDGVDTSDVPDVCRDTGLTTMVSAVPATMNLSLHPGARVIGAGDQLRVPVAELANGGMDAAMGSDLAVVADRCLGVQGPGTDTLLIWPFGTTVSYDPDPVVLLPDGTTYAVGDRLDLAGGYVDESTAQDDAPRALVAGLPDECQGLDRFLISPF